MNKVTFNNSIELESPDGFNQLSDIENQKYFTGNLLRLSFHNPEKHILLSLSKSKDSFLNRFFSVESVAANVLTNLENNLKDYQYIEQYSASMCDKPSLIGCFSYTANDENIKQYGELTIFKIKKSIYSIYCVSRLDDKEEAKEIFKKFRDSFVVNNN